MSNTALAPTHPRSIGWLGGASLAMGGSNQSLFLIGALLLSQGSASIPLLAAGLILSFAAAPGWLELVLMWPNRVGGIAATCAEAFRPYGAILANLTGVCYWWGWVPTCGLTALLAASAIHQWYLPGLPTPVVATGIVVAFTLVNLAGVSWAARVAIPLATLSALLAIGSAFIPVLAGTVDWHQAVSYHLDSPFSGAFGALTSAMAGLYLIGFAAPAFEAALAHVGEMKDPNRNVPRALVASAAMAVVYFVILPVVWLGVFGSNQLEGDLSTVLGPTFAPLFGAFAKAAAIWFMVFNMFHGTLQPLAGASRVLMQLSLDGLLPRAFAKRSRRDVPWVATLVTAAVAIVFLLAGDPIWMIAAANLTYLIGIAMPNVAVWLLRRNEPKRHRPYRAPRGMIGLGLVAACAWGLSTIFGFEQFGLPTVLFGIALAYSGSVLYLWRSIDDHRAKGEGFRFRSLNLKLTGAMLVVISLDGVGYLLAVSTLSHSGQLVLVTICEDIFVAVALLTITVGLILPGMIGHAATAVAAGADRLAQRTLPALMDSIEALGRGDLESVPRAVQTLPIAVHSADELGEMAANFNLMQEEVRRAGLAVEATRQQLRMHRDNIDSLSQSNLALEMASRHKTEFLATMSHELRTPMNSILGFTQLLVTEGFDPLTDRQRRYIDNVTTSGTQLLALINDVLDLSQVESGEFSVDCASVTLAPLIERCVLAADPLARPNAVRLTQRCAKGLSVYADERRVEQIVTNLLSNALKFSRPGGSVSVIATERGAEIAICVKDNGLGIPPEFVERVFEKFVQVDSTPTRQQGGTGLGLALCRAMAEAMGGIIELRSKLEVGTEVTVLLPMFARRLAGTAAAARIAV